jgi:hypothetical protein
MTKNEEAKNWLDRINWRLLADDATTPPRAPLNAVNWEARQFIAGIRRGIRAYVPNEAGIQTGLFTATEVTENE